MRPIVHRFEKGCDRTFSYRLHGLTQSGVQDQQLDALRVRNVVGLVAGGDDGAAGDVCGVAASYESPVHSQEVQIYVLGCRFVHHACPRPCSL